MAVRRFQQGFPAQGSAVDMAQPAAPFRRLAATGQARRHRVAHAGLCRLGGETAIGDIACRTHGQYGRQRRAIEAGCTGKGRTSRHQQCAAIFHIAGDIVEIERRHDIAPAITVEDNQIELVQAFHEQFLDRKSDQGEFVDRGCITPVRRPQDREVNQIDRRV